MKTPPKIPLRFLRWFCKPELLKYIEGDLIELYKENLERGKGRAKWFFAREVVKLFRPGIVRNLWTTQNINQMDMIRNYFKIGLRSILRHKAFSFLNIAGLSVGIASSLLILVYIQNERSYDNYHKDANRIYRVLHTYGNIPLNPSPTDYQVWGNAPVAPALKDFFPGIEQVFRFTSPSPWLIEYGSKRFQEDNIVFADSSAFEVFSWELVSGNPKTALVRPNTIVISETLARKCFGEEDALGKVVTMDTDDLFEVTGVMKDIPHNSHFTFEGMVSMSTFYNRRSGIFDSWGYVDFYTYFKVKPGVDVAAMKLQVPELVEKHIGDRFGYDIDFEPLADAYMHSVASRQPGIQGNKTNMIVFIVIAIFLLVIACINFMNLTTSRSVERAKDVAIRKTVGSGRGALVVQFLVEAIVLTFLSAVIAVGLMVLALPYLEVLSAKQLSLDWLMQPGVVIGWVFGVLLIGFMAGSYPAFVLSGFQPVKVLKGSFKTSKSGVQLRKALVVVQFGLSIMLVVGTMVVYSQLEFMRNHELGFQSSQVLVLDFGWDQKVQRKLSLIKEKLKAHRNVIETSYARAAPGRHFPNAGTQIEGPDGEMLGKAPYLYEIDEDFIPTFDMEMATGRNYHEGGANDSLNSLIINEAAVKLYGYSSPEEVIGKKFFQWGREGRVVGVVKDFNFKSLHHAVEPLALRYATWPNTSIFVLRLRTDDLKNTLQDLETTWSELVPHRPFLAEFVDDTFNRQYAADERFGSVFRVFSLIAIFIACLGLFGLTIYATAQRTKEIGIRKVLGASVFSIVSLLSMDFVKLFIVSLFIAIPVSWYVMSRWLENFSYGITVGWEVFAIAALLILLISLITMSLRTVRAAIANPVNALKDE
ncbi:MAG: ABC transporter permease [Marinoscillum sp.]